MARFVPRKSSFLFALTIAFAGCAATPGGQISSLEDLSTESIKEGVVKIPQYRVTSVPGWLPFADVGGLYFYKPSRKPASVIGISPNDSSFEIVSEISNENCREDCLAGIRSDITELGKVSARLIQERLALLTEHARQLNRKEEDAAKIKEIEAHHQKTQEDFDAIYAGAVKKIKDNGVLIYRWTVDSQQSSHLGLDHLLTGSAENKKTLNGFALVSGIRTKTLFVGRDLLGGWKNLDKESRFHNRFELTTHVMQAKYIMYGTVADLGSFAQAKLDASAKQLANLPEELKNLAQIDLEFSISKIANLSNMGAMGKIKRKAVPIRWDADDLQKRFEADEWLTFFSVESDFTDLLELLEPTIRPK